MKTDEKPQRVWQMRRLGPGDYALPSNDQQVMWRVQKYEERDGTLTRGDTGRVINGDFWRLLRWVHPVYAIAYEDIDEPGNWQEVARMMKTRQEAIDCAMALDERLP